jgi:hypothetical protein
VLDIYRVKPERVAVPDVDFSGYNVIVLENLIFLNYPEDSVKTSFTLEFDRHDGSGDIKWEQYPTSPSDPEYWEITFEHNLDSNNLISIEFVQHVNCCSNASFCGSHKGKKEEARKKMILLQYRHLQLQRNGHCNPLLFFTDQR